MLYGELGRYSISSIIKKRIVGFLYNLINKKIKLSSILYKFIFNHANVHNFEYKWLANVKSIFEATGLNSICLKQASTQSRNVFVNKTEAIIKKQYMQYWHNDISTYDKCLNVHTIQRISWL